jgi:DNA invertase Pin-like site-specific DNA recombinase
MAVYGYARISSASQNLAAQVDALRAAGCDVIREETRTGTTTEGRTELRTLIDFSRRGDVICVTRIDRLARSVADLALIVRELESRGVALRATEQPIDTSSSAGRAFIGMLSVFSEFETAIRRDRQLEGIAKAKAEGRYKGRPASVDVEGVRRMKAEGVRPSDIAKALGIGRASVYRALAA